jgi:hypothetical protein
MSQTCRKQQGKRVVDRIDPANLTLNDDVVGRKLACLHFRKLGGEAPDLHEHHNIDKHIMADANKRKSGPGDARDDKHGKRSKVRSYILFRHPILAGGRYGQGHNDMSRLCRTV